MKFFHDADEKKRFRIFVNNANRQRLRVFAPLIAFSMLYELITDLIKRFHNPDSTRIINIPVFNVNISYHNLFAIIEFVMLICSLLIFIFTFIHKKKSEKFDSFFHCSVLVYGTLLVIVSVLTLLIDVSTFYEADFNFFFLISIIISCILYLNPLVLIPELLIGFFTIWILIKQNDWGRNYFPYRPYCIFILLTLCLCCLSRAFYILFTMRREEKIEKYKEDAEKENRLKSLFLANMSHEIRTPMNAIIGMSELALDFNLEDSEKNTIRQIRSSGIALVNIINDILDFSKIESGKLDIIPVNYDIFKMVYDAANVSKVKLAGKNVEMIIEMNPEIKSDYNGDDLRLRQILINLANNAAKFTDKGFIVIRVEQIKKLEDKEVLRFSVIDTGNGIKEEDLKKLFAAFQQVDMKTNRTKEGTGLGLSISKRLVELMGGKIGVESQYGKGSCFYFEIPQKVVTEKKVSQIYRPIFDAAKVDKKHPELKVLPLEKFLNTKQFAALFAEKSNDIQFICPNAKILVVDDNEVNIQVANGLLKKFGVIPETALSGFQALEKISETDFDLIYMDHQMPEMDGVETLRRLREKEKPFNKHSNVIALSANAVNGAKDMFLKNGFDDFVAKPVQGKDFGESLKKWLPSNLIEEKTESNEEDIVPPDFNIPDSNKINLTEALERAGGFENWLQSTKTFGSMIEKKSSTIENLLNEMDFKNYTIEVHALKSSAKIIGADDLSEQAKYLESLGNKIQTMIDGVEALKKEICEKTASLLKLYRSYTEVLKDAKSYGEKPESEKEIISKDKLEEILHNIKTSAFENDLGGTEENFNKLSKYSIPENLAPIYEKLKEAVENIDFDIIISLLD